VALTTSLVGRVRNTSLPKSHALLPLLEAVVNSIQAIDDRYGDDVGHGRITVRILRRQQGDFDFGPTSHGRAPLEPIVGFSIEDNGVGFTPENMESFETLDSTHKEGLGCRGVGRLLWLKAFDRVFVSSAYHIAAGELRGVRFRFSTTRDVEQLGVELGAFDEAGAVVHLDGFAEAYQKNAAKTAEAIAREVFEHCIWYFLRDGGAPEVLVVDDHETIPLKGMLDELGHSDQGVTTIDVKDKKFTMVNLRLKSSTRYPQPRLYWCAGSRVVMDENLTGRVPGLYGRLKDATSKEFTYVCYLSSNFLDEHVRADRTAFDLPERVAGQAALDEPSLDDIRTVVLEEVERILAEPLSAARDEGKARVNEFVSQTAPRYRPVLSRLESLGVTIDPSMKDQDLELLLHRNLQKLDAQAMAEGQAVFAEAGSLPPEEYAARLTRYLEMVKDINQSDLAAYVARRHTLLDGLARLIRLDGDGKYSKEDAIHQLLFPMRTDSNGVATDASNLWIVDERLAFHEYLASDMTLKSMPITGSDSTTRPDIMSMRLVDSPVLTAEGETLPLPSIVVIEIKRPMRNDATEDRDPIQQCLEYVDRVRAGRVRTTSGRPIPETKDQPAFCYVLADLTPKMIERCKYAGLRPTYDGMGYFGFNEPYKAFVEVISFDRLVNAANERNRAFFDRLGLPTALDVSEHASSSAA
jgi:hypothetical protein